MRKQKIGYRCIYEGTSLEEFLTLKNRLTAVGVDFQEEMQRNDSWISFFTRLFVAGRGSYGMNGEHEPFYCLYVREEDAGKALECMEAKKHE